MDPKVLFGRDLNHRLEHLIDVGRIGEIITTWEVGFRWRQFDVVVIFFVAMVSKENDFRPSESSEMCRTWDGRRGFIEERGE